MTGLGALNQPRRHVVLLGDLECHAPLDVLAEPLLAEADSLHWIFGNHDYDGGPEMWTRLVDPTLNPVTAAGALHGRVVEVNGVRIAGLGGTFRPNVWAPPREPKLRSRRELPHLLPILGPGWTEESAARLGESLAAVAIWPEDVAALAEQRADVLVTHEAPSSHSDGLAVIDDLARAMGARLVVHGHHHITYRSVSADGALQAQGVGAYAGVDLLGRLRWAGETDRWRGRARKGWHAVEAA